ncbi:MAG: hypothetical protein HY928_07200 [Elusimicrobia bacterium]|nr:hypothetical protein [Elusimicrobiota bacterium]
MGDTRTGLRNASYLAAAFGLLAAALGGFGLRAEPPADGPVVWLSGSPLKWERFVSGQLTHSSTKSSRAVKGCRLWLLGDPRVYSSDYCPPIEEFDEDRWSRSTPVEVAVDSGTAAAEQATMRGLKVGRVLYIDPARAAAVAQEDVRFAACLFWGGLAVLLLGLTGVRYSA